MRFAREAGGAGTRRRYFDYQMRLRLLLLKMRASQLSCDCEMLSDGE